VDNLTIKRDGGVGRAKLLLEVIDKDTVNFLQIGALTTIGDHNCWNEIPSVIMIHQCMEKLGASITFFEKITFDLLAEFFSLYKLQL
jgi:hypothetical protein